MREVFANVPETARGWFFCLITYTCPRFSSSPSRCGAWKSPNAPKGKAGDGLFAYWRVLDDLRKALVGSVVLGNGSQAAKAHEGEPKHYLSLPSSQPVTSASEGGSQDAAPCST